MPSHTPLSRLSAGFFPVAGHPLLVTALIAIVGVILLGAFGVVHEAEHLARRLGDPYGSLVLTLSIVLIEVVLIAAVLLGPGEHAMIARLGHGRVDDHPGRRHWTVPAGRGAAARESRP